MKNFKPIPEHKVYGIKEYKRYEINEHKEKLKDFELTFKQGEYGIDEHKAKWKKILGIAGCLLGIYLGNCVISSSIASTYEQKKRVYYYESRFDFDYVKGLDQKIKYWKTNAKFPYANELELFKENEKPKPSTPQETKKRTIIEDIEDSHYYDCYVLKFRNGQFVHNKMSLTHKCDSLTLYKEENEKIITDDYCDEKVDEIVEWNAATKTLKTYVRILYTSDPKMFSEADEILTEKKEQLNVEKYQKIWEQKRKDGLVRNEK
ncbi:MAG: hypothetical protein Q8O03_07510 [Nanoarchaeota archaeon]|nr:hypothetical protein [Nanoarchaeota archaeon]